MAKLPSLKFEFKSKAGEPLAFTSPVSVLSDGLFSVGYPEELHEIVRGILSARNIDSYDISTNTGEKNWRVYAKSLDACREIIGAAGREYVECVVTKETIILYSYRNNVSYTRTDDGEIYPNGYCDGSGTKKGIWRGLLNATTHSDHFSVGFAAVVMHKYTYTRASSTKIEYKAAPPLGGHHRAGTLYHDRLNNFVGLRLDPRCMKEMPYTEEAAKFFYDTMIAMCSLAERIQCFFSDERLVLEGIAKQQKLLSMEQS